MTPDAHHHPHKHICTRKGVSLIRACLCGSALMGKMSAHTHTHTHTHTSTKAHAPAQGFHCTVPDGQRVSTVTHTHIHTHAQTHTHLQRHAHTHQHRDSTEQCLMGNVSAHRHTHTHAHTHTRTSTGVSLDSACLRGSAVMGSRPASTRASTDAFMASILAMRAPCFEGRVPFLTPYLNANSDLRCANMCMHACVC